MADEEVKVKIAVEGAPAAVSAVSSVISSFMQFKGVATDLNQGLELAKKGIEALEAPFKMLEANAAAATELFKHFRSMAATMGESIEDAEVMSDTFALAGLSTEKLTFGLFRLSMAIQQGGKELAHIGVEFKDAEGHIKSTGTVFEEVRDRLSKYTNATERAAEAAKLFGARQARELLPVLSMTSEEYSRLKTKAEESSSTSNRLEKASKELIESQAELADQLEKVRTEFAVMISMPVVHFFEEWIAIPIVSYLDNVLLRMRGIVAIGTEGAGGTGGWAGFFKGVMAMAGTSKEAAEEVQKNIETLEKATRKVQQLKEVRESKASYTDDDRKAELEKLNFSYKMGEQALKFDEKIAAQRLQIQTGSEAASLQKRKEGLAEELALAEEHIAKEREIMLKGRVRLSGQEELKLSEKLAKEREKIREESAKVELDIERAKVKDIQKILEVELAHRKQMNQQALEYMSLSHEQEMAAIKVFHRSSTDEAQLTYYESMRFVTQTTNSKLSLINSEISEKTKQLSMVKGFADEERRIQKEIEALETSRVQTKVNADKEILASRQALFAKIKQLADQEASLGESAEQKAIRRLQAKGKTKVSAADVYAEEGKLEREGASTATQFAYGGKVDITALQESRETGKMLGKATELGTTPYSAMGMFQKQQAAAYSGQAFNAIPTGMAGMGDKIALLAKTMQSGMDQTIDRLDGLLGDMFNKFSDALVRKLEFQAAQQ